MTDQILIHRTQNLRCANVVQWHQLPQEPKQLSHDLGTLTTGQLTSQALIDYYFLKKES